MQHMLAPELEAKQLSIPQQGPRVAFRGGRLTAQSAGEGTLACRRSAAERVHFLRFSVPLRRMWDRKHASRYGFTRLSRGYLTPYPPSTSPLAPLPVGASPPGPLSPSVPRPLAPPPCRGPGPCPPLPVGAPPPGPLSLSGPHPLAPSPYRERGNCVRVIVGKGG